MVAPQTTTEPAPWQWPDVKPATPLPWRRRGAADRGDVRVRFEASPTKVSPASPAATEREFAASMSEAGRIQGVVAAHQRKLETEAALAFLPRGWAEIARAPAVAGLVTLIRGTADVYALGDVMRHPELLLPSAVAPSGEIGARVHVAGVLLEFYRLLCTLPEGRKAILDLGFQPLFQQVESP